MEDESESLVSVVVESVTGGSSVLVSEALLLVELPLSLPVLPPLPLPPLKDEKKSPKPDESVLGGSSSFGGAGAGGSGCLSELSRIWDRRLFPDPEPVLFESDWLEESGGRVPPEEAKIDAQSIGPSYC